MPKMKAAKKPSARKTSKKSARKASKRKAAPSFFERAARLIENYTIAATAGAAVLLVMAGLVFWAGGYVGAASEKLAKATGDMMVSAGLEVQRVTLRGAHNTAHADVLDALGPVIGESVVHVDLADARRRVEDIGWVRAASVTRLLPNTLHISVREREPAAIWQMDQSLNLVDAFGAVIRKVNAYEYSQLPMIVGAGAPEAASGILTALATEPDLQYMTYAVVRVGERRWNLRLRNGVDIKLPETDYQDAIKDVSLLHTAHGTLDQPLEYIDLRDRERLIIRKRGEATDRNIGSAADLSGLE